jgi:hypothetical protein
MAEAVPGASMIPPAVNPWLLHAGVWAAVILCGVITYALLLHSNKLYAVGFAVLAVPSIAIVLFGATLSRLLGSAWHPAVKLAVGSAIATVLLPVAIVYALFIACTDICTGNF